MLRLFWRLAEAIAHALRWLVKLPIEAAAALQGRDQGNTPKRPRLVIAMAVILPIALLASLALPKVTLVVTPSIAAWAVREAEGPIVKGDLVMFTLSHPVAGPKPVSVTKYALCMPGERLTMIETPSPSTPRSWDGHYYCNDELLGVSLPEAAHGLKLTHFQWSGGLIPVGQVYVGSHHPRGFDSRYFGLISIGRLTRMTRIL